MRPFRNCLGFVATLLSLAVLLVCAQSSSAQTRSSKASNNFGKNYYLPGFDAKGFTKSDYSFLKTSDAVKIYNLKQEEVKRMNAPVGEYFVPIVSLTNYSVKNDTYKIKKVIDYRLFYTPPTNHQLRRI